MTDRREFRFEFPCPSCQARLRLKDRQLIGTKWNCPECQSELVIVDAGQGDLTAQLSQAPAAPSPLRPRRSGSPQVVAALVAVALITALAVFVLRAPDSTSSPVPAGSVAEEGGKEQPSVPAVPQPVDAADLPAINPVHDQLLAMGKWLKSQHDRDGAFPSAVVPSELPVEDRLSWLASYREETEPVSSVHSDPTHSWRDPANEAFVRRRALSLLNPQITVIASDEGYPASHYVGVSGVGADSAIIPKSHPRAGVFGIDRRTTVDDIRDGTSNTLLVLGVEQHPPAWASGLGSVRGFTAEPYFSGPDHFGTGQADGMTVLLADGSVRFLSNQTDPKVMRRMAAMADGLPLDPLIPGEPTDPPASVSDHDVVNQAASPAADDPQALEPITVEIVPEPVGYDVERGLSIAIARYQLDKPVPLRQLLREVVEMSAVPIDTASLTSDPRLDVLVTLDLKETTLKELLATALQQAQLSFTFDAQGIHLIAAESGEAAPPPATTPVEQTSPAETESPSTSEPAP